MDIRRSTLTLSKTALNDLNILISLVLPISCVAKQMLTALIFKKLRHFARYSWKFGKINIIFLYRKKEEILKKRKM